MTVDEAKAINGTCDGWIAVFEIFKRNSDDGAASAEHDVIYAGPDPVNVSSEDIAVLEALGWHTCEEYNCFLMYT